MSISERIRHEIREIALVTVYFFTCFLFFLSMKKLLLEEYDVEITILGTAALGALIVAKVVILLGKTSLGNWFESQRILLHVLWRTAVYTAVVFVVTLAERLFDQYREVGEFRAALSKVWAGEDLDHFVAMNLGVGLSLLAFNLFAEIDRQLGAGALRRLILGPPREPARTASEGVE